MANPYASIFLGGYDGNRSHIFTQGYIVSAQSSTSGVPPTSGSTVIDTGFLVVPISGVAGRNGGMVVDIVGVIEDLNILSHKDIRNKNLLPTSYMTRLSNRFKVKGKP